VLVTVLNLKKVEKLTFTIQKNQNLYHTSIPYYTKIFFINSNFSVTQYNGYRVSGVSRSDVRPLEWRQIGLFLWNNWPNLSTRDGSLSQFHFWYDMDSIL